MMVRATARLKRLFATPASATPRASPQPGPRSGGTISRYLLSQIARPFAATLLIVLPALLLERLLRLFTLIATKSVPTSLVMRMLIDLVPQYLGLALPAALFLGVFSVVGRLSANNELDAMQNAGFSLRSISLPFLATGLVAAIAGFGLYGYAQPYARYAYRATLQAATDGVWNASIPAGEITRVTRDLIVTADKSDSVTGRLSRVAIYQHAPNGREKITTARTALLTPSPDGGELQLTLDQATQVETWPDGRTGWLTSPSAALNHPYVLHLKAFRQRGADEWEMTAGELLSARRHPHPGQQRRALDAELHSRIVRSLSLAVLPFLAIPFGLAAKRSRQQYGIVVGLVILVLYYHAVQLGQSLGASGLIEARPVLWAIFAIFTAACLAVFRRAEHRTSEGPLDALFGLMDSLLEGLAASWRAFRTKRA